MPKHILVCEDDESILEVLTLILEEEGYTVTARNHCAGIEDIRAVKPDLLLIDLWIPEIGGVEVCKALKADKQLKNIPVILISATSDLDKTAKKCKANDYIQKPFDIAEIPEKIGKLLK